MSNGDELRASALAAWPWPDKPRPETDPVMIFRMAEWYPSVRDQLVRTRLTTAVKVFQLNAELSNAYANAASEVLEQVGAAK
jgi:hypothetical protein